MSPHRESAYGWIGYLGIAAGIAAAVVIHAAILLFGGIFFMGSGAEDPKKAKIENVELVQTQDDAKKKEQEKKAADEEAKKEEEKQQKEEIKEAESVPDLKELEKLDAAAAPGLDAMSLSALEDALNPSDVASGEGGFLQNSVDFASGGRIGGTGRASGAEEGGGDGAFAIAELDQKPRAILQTAPQYPYELRQKKIEGTVSVLFIVDETGRVVNPKIETSPNPGFERPVLEAVRQWKFEAAVRGGKKVAARMRVPLRFSAGS